MAEQITVEAGDEYESEHNGEVYTVQRVEGEKVQLANHKTGASWHSLDKVVSDIENGTLS